MMEHWALVSGLHGDLDLYERIQNDLKTRRGVAHLFVLGDMISPDRDCNALLTRLRRPKRGDLHPHCIYGWWEEQLLAESGYRGDQQAVELHQQNNAMALEQLRAAVDRAGGARAGAPAAGRRQPRVCCRASRCPPRRSSSPQQHLDRPSSAMPVVRHAC